MVWIIRHHLPRPTGGATRVSCLLDAVMTKEDGDVKRLMRTKMVDWLVVIFFRLVGHAFVVMLSWSRSLLVVKGNAWIMATLDPMLIWYILHRLLATRDNPRWYGRRCLAVMGKASPLEPPRLTAILCTKISFDKLWSKLSPRWRSLM